MPLVVSRNSEAKAKSVETRHTVQKFWPLYYPPPKAQRLKCSASFEREVVRITY